MTKNLISISKQIIIAIAANILFTVFEFVMGILTNSLALISDGALNLADVFSLCITLTAQKIALIKPNEKKNFGYGRATFIAAFINGCFLLSFAVFIFIKAYERVYNPEQIEGGWVMLIGLMGIVINGGAASLLLNFRADLNIRSAYLNMLFDALASAAALFSGLIIYFTGFTLIDPIISSFIGILLLYNSYQILSEITHIFLEGIPTGIDRESIKNIIINNQEVKSLESLHVWSISTQTIALNAKIKVENMDISQANKFIETIKDQLKKEANFEHIIIELCE